MIARPHSVSAAGVLPWRGLFCGGMMGVLLCLPAGGAETFGGTTVPVSPPRQGAPLPTPREETSSSTPLSTKPFTKINSDLLNFDYEKHIAIFEGNVVAVDPKLTLKCNKMVVYFAEKRSEVLSVVATGNVRMYQEGKEAYGDKGVFTRETDLIVLSGTRPKLKDEKGNWIVSRGEGIIYNVRTKQMTVDHPEMEVQSSGGSDLMSPANPK